ncbi:hypothetical protein, partial [Rhodococcus sp. LB1]|uniref:hypothetical protein n=1 Tax=Rhodococcus sp. LB1 TaxID=1807499 RepID=UPI001E40AFAE
MTDNIWIGGHPEPRKPVIDQHHYPHRVGSSDRPVHPREEKAAHVLTAETPTMTVKMFYDDD